MQAAGGALSMDQVASLARHVWGDGPSDIAGVPAWVRAGSVGWDESRGDPHAVNPIPVNGGCRGAGSHHATGVWQIIPACHPDCEESRLTEPLFNAQCAYKISAGGKSWSAWSTKQTARRFEKEIAAANTGAPAPPGAGSGGLNIGPVKIPNPFDTAGNAADAVGAIGDLLAFVTNRENWMRLLWVWLGLGLVTAGVLIVNRDTATRAVTAVATGGTSEAAGAVAKVAA